MPTSLADLEGLIERVLDENVRAGCRSLKSAIAYDRTLEVGPTSRRKAAAIFGIFEQRISPADRKRFGDSMILHWLDRARERRLVFQVHTGIARLSGSNPLLLEPLLQAYPGRSPDCAPLESALLSVSCGVDVAQAGFWLGLYEFRGRCGRGSLTHDNDQWSRVPPILPWFRLMATVGEQKSAQ